MSERIPGRGVRPVGAAAASVALLLASSAFADSAKDAERLFNESKKLLDQGRTAEACPKLAESQRLDPGGGTLMFLALCHEKEGKTASAFFDFNETLSVAQRAGRADRERVAKEHLAALTPRLRKLVVTVPAEVASAPDFSLLRDGEPIAKEVWGTPVPVDPGPHKLVARARGKKDWEASVEIGTDGETVTSTVSLVDVEAPQKAEGSAWPRAKTQRVAAIGLGAGGLVGIAVGSAFGAISMSKWNAAGPHCSGKTCKDGTGVKLRNESVAAGDASTVGFVVGGVLLAGGVALWVTAPRSPDKPKVGLWAAPDLAGGRFGARGEW